MLALGVMKIEKDIFHVNQTFKVYFLSEKTFGVKMLLLKFYTNSNSTSFKIYTEAS